MFSRFSLNKLLILGSYLLISATPFIPYLFGRQINAPWQTLGVAFFAWTVIWAVFKRPAYFHWLLLPAFLAFPTSIYLHIYYGQGITPHHLGIIAETNPSETIEFLGSKVWLLIFIMVLMIAWWAAIWRLTAKTRDLDWRHRTSRWVVLGMAAVFFSLSAYGYAFGVDAPPKTAVAQNEGSASDIIAEEEIIDESTKDDSTSPLNLPSLPSWLALPVERDVIGDTWPFGLGVHLYDFWAERQYLTELNERNQFFTFKARQVPGTEKPQVIVLVIGESSRYDRWGINGYPRNTTPLLKQEKNLVSLRNIITPVSATRLSVPIIISRKPARQSLASGFYEKSLITVFKEAGYKTYWLSNQISFGEFDTPVSAFAKESDVIQFMNLGGYTDGSNFDEILLGPMQHALQDPSPKKLIILHTLGNHWNYSHRHPQAFDKWVPSLFGMDKPDYTDTALKPQLNNSYDNSILYTDWFLSQVIARLKAGKSMSSLFFIADHGQVLYDGTCDLAFHGHNTQYEFHVPAFVWYSDQYKHANPEKVAQLIYHRRSRLSTENVFHTLVDMANIQYPDEHLEWSFANRRFRRHRRYVDSLGWTNYDNSIFKGDCREVIDRGKPLAQE